MDAGGVKDEFSGWRNGQDWVKKAKDEWEGGGARQGNTKAHLLPPLEEDEDEEELGGQMATTLVNALNVATVRGLIDHSGVGPNQPLLF